MCKYLIYEMTSPRYWMASVYSNTKYSNTEFLNLCKSIIKGSGLTRLSADDLASELCKNRGFYKLDTGVTASVCTPSEDGFSCDDTFFRP